MIALILDGDYVKNVYPDYTQGVHLVDKFILIDALPQAFVDLPDNMIVKYENGTFTRVTRTLPVAPPDRVADLTAQVDDLKEQLAVTNATVDFLLGI